MKDRLLDAAELAHTLAIEGDGTFADAHSNLGLIQMQRGDIVAALRSHKCAVRLDESNPRFHFNLGITFANMGEPAQAIISFDRTIELNSNYTDAYFNKGASLLQMQKLDAAIACFQQTLKLHNKYPSKEPARAYTYLGRAWLKQGNIDGAIMSYEAGVRLDAKSVEAHYGLGKALKLKGDRSATIMANQRALKDCGSEYTSRCSHCCKPAASLRCARCKCVSYCSKQCQRADWKPCSPFAQLGLGLSHKNLCKDMAEAMAKTAGCIEHA